VKIEFKYSRALDRLSFELTGESMRSYKIEDFIKKLEEEWKAVEEKTIILIKTLTGVDVDDWRVYVSTTIPSYASISPLVLKITDNLFEALDTLIYILTVKAIRMNEELKDRLNLMSIASGYSVSIFEKCISMYVRFKILKKFYGEQEVRRIKYLISKRSSNDRIALDLYNITIEKLKRDTPEDFMKTMVSFFTGET